MSLKSIISGLLEVFIDFIFYIIPWDRPSSDQIKKVKIVAHRGWHNNKDIYENTIKAFDLAHENKLWGIELDIRWTKDGVPVIHHDANCIRVWNQDIEIKDKTLDELKSIVPEIPTLDEVVSLYGKKLHLFIEIKEEPFVDLIQQKETLKKVLTNLDPIVDFHLIALNVEPLKSFNIYDLKTYLLVSEFNVYEMSRLALMHQFGGVTGHFLLCTNDIVKKHREANQKVGTGFIRTGSALKREVSREMDWVFTNHPWNLVSFIESYDSKTL